MAKLNDKLLQNIKVIKIEKYASLSTGWHEETLQSIQSIPEGYTFFTIVPNQTNKSNVFPIFNYNNGEIKAYVQILSTNTTVTYSCNVVFVKTEFLNQILI